MFSSFAALSSSSSIGDAKSTFTRWIGPIMRPALVKKGETSFPLSASRAMFSADTGFFCLRVLFIKFLLLLSRFPQRDEVIVLSVAVFPHFKNERLQPFSHPANSPVLLWHIRALVKVVGMLKYLLRLFKSDPSLWV